jgi:hypothetical protein
MVSICKVLVFAFVFAIIAVPFSVNAAETQTGTQEHMHGQTMPNVRTQTNPKDGEPKIVHAKNSPAPESVSFRITEPTEGQVVPGPDVTVKFTIQNWKLYKEGDHGQHIHFILDNEPYQAHYSSTEPFVFKNVSAGPHVIRAFPSRPWHESVKQDDAFSIVQFYVKDKSGTPLVDATKPMLVYSRPKGEYLLSKPPFGQPVQGILIDWFTKNVRLGKQTGYTVRATIDGTAHTFLEWRPHYVQGLGEGEHTFKLELLHNGAPVEGNFNTTERKITIKP